MSARDQIVEKLESTASWRQEKAAEYPDDERNLTAVKELGQLAESVRAIPEGADALRSLGRLWEDDDTLAAGVERENELVRSIGFGNCYDGDGWRFVRDLLDIYAGELPNTPDQVSTTPVEPVDEFTQRRHERDGHKYRLIQADYLLTMFRDANGRGAKNSAELAEWVKANGVHATPEAVQSHIEQHRKRLEREGYL